MSHVEQYVISQKRFGELRKKLGHVLVEEFVEESDFSPGSIVTVYGKVVVVMEAIGIVVKRDGNYHKPTCNSFYFRDGKHRQPCDCECRRNYTLVKEGK